MNIKVFATLLFISLAVTAQVPPPPSAPPAAPAAGAPLPPVPGTVAVPATPTPGVIPVPPPPANNGPGAPVSGTEPPAPAPAVPVLTPVNTGPILPSLVNPTGDKAKGAKDADKEDNRPSVKDIEKNSSLRNKSPFMIPTDLYLKIKRRQGERIVEKEIDDTVSAKLRWPLRSYTLMGVYAGVKVPKALIQDKEGKIHVFRTKELIANSGGYISEIGNGEVIVVERGAEIKLSLKKDSKN